MQSNGMTEHEINKLQLAVNFRSGQIDDTELTYLLSHITQYIRRSHKSLFSEADDIASEAVLEAFESINSLKDNALFFAWVRSITRYVVLYRLKKLDRMQLQSRDAFLEATNDESPEEVRALQEQAGLDDEAWLRTMALKDARAALNDEQRAVISLRIDEQYASKEVAQMLGMKDDNVRQIGARACREMREYLTRNGYADLFRVETQRCRPPVKPIPAASTSALSARA